MPVHTIIAAQSNQSASSLTSSDMMMPSLQEVDGCPEVRVWSLHNHSSFSKHWSISLIARAHTLNIAAGHLSLLPSMQLSVHWSAGSSDGQGSFVGLHVCWALKGRLLWVLLLTPINERSEMGQWRDFSSAVVCDCEDTVEYSKTPFNQQLLL